MPDLIAEIVMGSFVVVAGLLFLCHACYARSSHPPTHRIFCPAHTLHGDSPLRGSAFASCVRADVFFAFCC